MEPHNNFFIQPELLFDWDKIVPAIDLRQGFLVIAIMEYKNAV